MKVKGKNLLVFMNEGSGYKSVAVSTSCSLSVNVNAVPVMSAESWRWQQFTPGKMGWQVQTAAQITTEVDPMSLLNRTVRIMFGTSGDNHAALPPGSRTPDGVLRRYGDAMITSIQESGERSGIAKYEMQFVGIGELHHDSQPEPHGSIWYNHEDWEEPEKWKEE